MYIILHGFKSFMKKFLWEKDIAFQKKVDYRN